MIFFVCAQRIRWALSFVHTVRLIVLGFGLATACTSPEPPPLFTEVAREAGVQFVNRLTYTNEFNPYTYRNFYNGAGVAIGDINNDGLLDVYFAGNQVDNKLFLNTGGFRFADVTQKAGVACSGVWSTGVSFVDINGDGWLDIYVCKSGPPGGANRHNELFVNNRDLTFTERSKEYGLDFVGLSIQAAFFDYDRDGDLDCYLLTNSIRSIGGFDYVKDQRVQPDPQNGGNKFLLNQGSRFIDVTEQVGIFRSAIGFGLGVTLGDFDGDSWTDIYVSNDFFERDYLYLNNQRGGFNEALETYFETISMGSMGADYADLDNDGLFELFVTEMLPDSLGRRKSKTVYQSWDQYQNALRNGYHHQVSRNVLQKKVSKRRFVEVGRMAGVAATEWSWGALLFDMDNDGLRDIFVASGIGKDLLDRDYLAFSASEEKIRQMISRDSDGLKKLVDLMPSSRFKNYAYQNQGGLRFADRASNWGLDVLAVSTGSAYGDLDNDGDLDLVVSTVNSESLVFRNNTDTANHASFSIALRSSEPNSLAVGAQVSIFQAGSQYTADNFTVRGYQSSVQNRITIGVGLKNQRADSVLVRWPEGDYSMHYDLPVNQIVELVKPPIEYLRTTPNVQTRSDPVLDLIARVPVSRKGDPFVDFNREKLLPLMYSEEYAFLVTGDIDGDQTTEALFSNKDGFLTKVEFLGDSLAMQTQALPHGIQFGEASRGVLFDADKDGDLDLYFATGGRSYPTSSNGQLDYVLINDGRGNFSNYIPIPLPAFSTGAVVAFDFDHDFDMDLLVGERFNPFTYGTGGRVYLLQNDGKGFFSDVTPNFLEGGPFPGMVTDALATDVNKDGWTDVVLIGDWMPVRFLINSQGKLQDDPKRFPESEGWWSAIATADLNGDGTPDFVLGNHGLNSFFRTGDRMYVADFDENGSKEQVFCTRQGDSYYPIADRDDLVAQIPSVRKSVLYFRDYAARPIEDLFAGVEEKSKVFQVNRLESSLLLSNGIDFQFFVLPNEVQFAPVFALLVDDINRDGVPDLVVGGNLYGVKPQFGRFDASEGWFFEGRQGNKGVEWGRPKSLGIKGQIRDIEMVKINGQSYLIFAKYDEVEIYRVLH